MIENFDKTLKHLCEGAISEGVSSAEILAALQRRVVYYEDKALEEGGHYHRWTALIRDSADISHLSVDHLAYDEEPADYEQANTDAEYTWEDVGFVIALYPGHLSLEEATDAWIAENGRGHGGVLRDEGIDKFIEEVLE